MEVYTNGNLNKERLKNALETISIGGVYIKDGGLTPESELLMDYDGVDTVTLKSDVVNLGIAFKSGIYVNDTLVTGDEELYYDTITINGDEVILSQSENFPKDKFGNADSVTVAADAVRFALEVD